MSIVQLSAGGGVSAELLVRLATGDITAIRVPDAITIEVADAMAAWMTTQTPQDYVVVVDRGAGPERIKVGVSRIGCPLNEVGGAADIDAAFREYLTTARATEAAMAAACAPHPRPIDSLVEVLAAAWPGGVVTARLGDDPLFAGIPRIVHPDAELLETQPHVDAVHPSALPLDHQISANIYLEVPPEGGGLEVWPGVPLTIDMMFAGHLPERLRREALGRSEVITPARREMVIINSRRPHAVRRFTHGRRFSVQSFIGIAAADAPLVLWS